MLKKISQKYFKYFSSKDLDLIGSMLSSKVILKDWDVYAEGKENVLSATKNIFDSVETIKVVVKDIYREEQTIIAKLDILINDKEMIKVVDIIQFDKSNKIINIRAFKG